MPRQQRPRLQREGERLPHDIDAVWRGPLAAAAVVMLLLVLMVVQVAGDRWAAPMLAGVE